MYGGTLSASTDLTCPIPVYPRVYGGTRMSGVIKIPACTGEPERRSNSPNASVYPRVYGGTVDHA